MPYTSPKRLYLTEDEQVVEEGDERARTLLVGEGGELSDADATKYGLLTPPDAKPDELKAAETPEANKAKAAAPQNKSKA